MHSKAAKGNIKGGGYLASLRLARLVALSRLTRGVVGGSFTRHSQIAFGHGGDRPSYVSAKGSPICPNYTTP